MEKRKLLAEGSAVRIQNMRQFIDGGGLGPFEELDAKDLLELDGQIGVIKRAQRKGKYTVVMRDGRAVFISSFFLLLLNDGNNEHSCADTLKVSDHCTHIEVASPTKFP
jgi:hypothetical protein